MTIKKLYTVTEVAKLLKFNEETIRGWLRRGKLRGIKIHDGWRITESELHKLLDEEPKKQQEEEED